MLIISGCASNPYLIRSSKNFFSDYPTFSRAEDVVNCIIEIPSGDIEKWAVNAKTGNLERDLVEGVPRVLAYAIAYPFNYGMIPQTIVSKKRGGDGDPVDIIVLGKSLRRASLQQARVLGILHMLDSGEVDDKVIAVVDSDTAFKHINTLEEFQAKFPQALNIVEIWFKNYKLSQAKVEIAGFSAKEEALSFINSSRQDYLTIPPR